MPTGVALYESDNIDKKRSLKVKAKQFPIETSRILP